MDVGIAGVELESLASRVAVDAREAAVQAADRAAFMPQQLLGEAEDLDAQIGAVNIVFRSGR